MFFKNEDELELFVHYKILEIEMKRMCEEDFVKNKDVVLLSCNILNKLKESSTENVKSIRI